LSEKDIVHYSYEIRYNDLPVAMCGITSDINSFIEQYKGSCSLFSKKYINYHTGEIDNSVKIVIRKHTINGVKTFDIQDCRVSYLKKEVLK